jgi:CHASE1-domain containing sensor protein
MTHLVPLAEVDENKVTPGVLGFIVFAVMALAVWGLMKSMSKQMNKVDFKEGADPKAEPTAESKAESGAASAEPKAKQG